MEGAPTSPRERVLDVVPGLDELIERGAPGDQVQSAPLSTGEGDAWLLWFVRLQHGLAISVPVAGVRAGAEQEALARCNEHNAALQWSTLSLADWDGEPVVSLAVRLPLPREEAEIWATVGHSIQHVLEAAGLARERFGDLIRE
jgi:hypothetical protein